MLRGMVSDRAAARVRADFSSGERDAVLDLLERLQLPFLDDDSPGRERVEAAVLLLACGDGSRLRQAAAQAELDWRDVLVVAGLANADWPHHLDALLGPSRADERTDPS
jgi:hypothetical protein